MLDVHNKTFNLYLILVLGGISDRGYSSMTHDELKTITEVNNQEEITPPQEKVKKEVKGSLRFNIPKKQKNITSNDDGLCII